VGASGFETLEAIPRCTADTISVLGGAMRIFWLDSVKALGIFLVVFGHMIPHSPLKQYVYSFHVPLFFFVSGYLFDRRKYNFGQFLRRRFSSLIIPYLFFAALSFLFWFFIVRNVSIGGRALAIDPLKPLIGILYGTGSGDWSVPMNPALWFLPCLFVVEMGFYFVRNRYFLLVFAILGYLVTFLPFRLRWGSDAALAAIVFYGIGHFYNDTWVPHKALPLLFVFHFASCFLNSPVDMNNLAYGNMFLFYVSACSGVLFYSALCKFVKKNKIVEYIGSNTVTLVGLVGITWFILNGVSYILFGTKMVQPGLGFALAASILQIGLSIPAIYCINKWFPFILN
jgi:acyltransferase